MFRMLVKRGFFYRLVMCKDKRNMELNQLLDKLCVNDKTILIDFFAAFSRVEYALKRSGYTTTNNRNAEANWPKFIKNNKSKFNSQSNQELILAVDYLLKFPAKQQVVTNGDLDFTEHHTTKEGPVLCRLYHCIRITRNNLFHGGKYPHGPVQDLSRNTKLIQNCLTVLKEIIELDQKVKHTFWETEQTTT